MNNAPVQSPTGDKIITAGTLLTFIVSAADADNDPIVYSTNATNGTLNSTTGEYSWQTTVLDEGAYTWHFNSSDNYGGTDSETITVTVTAQPISEFIPPVPTNLINTHDNLWINHSWEAGTGNVTDSYNVSVNDVWTNGTISTYNNTSFPPHGWSNITVYAYNISSTGSLSTGS